MNTLTSIVYTVRDLPGATAVHASLLGTQPHTDTPYYVGFNVGGVEIALTPQAPDAAQTAPIAYIGVADLEAAIDAAVTAGATLVGPPHDVGGGTRIATVTDPDGNTIGLIRSGS